MDESVYQFGSWPFLSREWSLILGNGPQQSQVSCVPVSQFLGLGSSVGRLLLWYLGSVFCIRLRVICRQLTVLKVASSHNQLDNLTISSLQIHVQFPGHSDLPTWASFSFPGDSSPPVLLPLWTATFLPWSEWSPNDHSCLLPIHFFRQDSSQNDLEVQVRSQLFLA